jgi:hypothetical protein
VNNIRSHLCKDKTQRNELKNVAQCRVGGKGNEEQ